MKGVVDIILPNMEQSRMMLSRLKPCRLELPYHLLRFGRLSGAIVRLRFKALLESAAKLLSGDDHTVHCWAVMVSRWT